MLKLHFSRFEFKYVLPRRVRDEVEGELGHFVELDPYVIEKPDHQYFVRSLYFDTPGYDSFYDKIDGLHTRAKFRIRTYTRALDDPAPWFLEIKGRYNNLVFKHRTPVTGGFDPRASGEALSRLLSRHAEPGTVLDQFEFDLYRKRIEPLVLVDYLRRPYISKFDPEFRLTFDHQLASTACATMFPGPCFRVRRLVPGYTVMEVKFRHHVPAWFHRIIQAYELRRVSLSKVVVGTETLGLATNLS